MKKNLLSLILIVLMGATFVATRDHSKKEYKTDSGLSKVAVSAIEDDVSTEQSSLQKAKGIGEEKKSGTLGQQLGDDELIHEDQNRDFNDPQAKKDYGVDRMMLMAFHNRPHVFKEALETYLNEENSIESLKNLKDKEGSNLLHWSVMGECSGCVELLLKKGFPVDLANKRGETALVYAASSGDENLTVKLLEAGANPNISFNEAGYTLLMDAAFEGQVAVAQALIKGKASINFQDKDGKSPLHYAATEGHEELVKLLMSAGANPQLTDQSGKKPVDYAVQYHGEALGEHLKL